MHEARTAEASTLRRMHHLMSQVNATPELPEILQTIADGVADVVGFEVAAINYLVADGTLECVAVAGSEEARQQLLGNRTAIADIEAEFEIADEWGILRFVPHHRLPEAGGSGWIPDMQPLDVPDAWHPEDALFAPLYTATGELVGLMAVDLPKDRRIPGLFQRELLEMYAVQAGIAISNALQRTRLAEQVRLATAVHRIMTTAGSGLDLGRLIDDSVEPIVSGLRCRAVWIRAFEGTGELPGRGRGAVYPPSTVPLQSDELIARAKGLAESCWRDQRAVVTTEMSMDPEGVLDDETQQAAVKQYLGQDRPVVLFAPMGAGPECLGYFALTRMSTDPPWSEDEVTAVLEIGRELGRAVLNARLFERERELVGRLRRLDRYKTELIATITHELRNPLAAIVGHLELLEAVDLSGPAERSIAAMARNSEKLEHLVDDLLLLSKVADPDRPFRPAEVDLARLAAESLEMFRVQAQKRELTLKLVAPDEPPMAWGDRAELDRAVTNVIANAVKYSRPGGTIAITVDATDDGVVFECRDDGLGISDADQAQLFAEFFRSSNPEAVAQPGTGLGLAIVKRILDRHRATVDIASTLGAGSTFRITIPSRPPGD